MQTSNKTKAEINITIKEDGLVIMEPKETPKYTLLFLHGVLHETSRYFQMFLQEEMVKIFDRFRVILPQAPVRNLNWAGYKEGTCWLTTDEVDIVDKETIPYLKNLAKDIASQYHENDTNKIVIGGFSQGGNVALYAWEQLKEIQFGGLIVESGFNFPPFEKKFKRDNDFKNALIIHGLKDEAMAWDNAKGLYKDIVERNGVTVVLIEGMKHDHLNSKGAAAIRKFLLENFE